MNALLACAVLTIAAAGPNPEVEVTKATVGVRIEAELDTGGRLAVLIVCGTMDRNGVVTWLYGPGMAITFTGTHHWMGPRPTKAMRGQPVFVMMYCPTTMQLLAYDVKTVT